MNRLSQLLLNLLSLLAFTLSLLSSAEVLAMAPDSPRTYYISSSAGNDENDGLSPQHAWQHLWKVYVKSTSRDPFHPGDRILLKRGDRWDGQIRIQARGTAQNPIVVDAYGEGAKPLIVGDGSQIQWKAVSGHNGIYMAYVGEGSILGRVFEAAQAMKAIFPSGALRTDADIETFLKQLQPGMAGPPSGNRVWIHLRDDSAPDGHVRLFRAAGVMADNSSYVQIRNLDIERFETGIDVSGADDILVTHNDIQDVLGIGIYLRTADRDCLVESNTVFRGGNTLLYVLKGSANTFRDNWVSHAEASILRVKTGGDKMGIGLQESQGTIVEHNYIAYSGGIDYYFEQGSTVRYNYLYRVTSSGTPHGVNLEVYGNIYNLAREPGKPGVPGVNAVATGPGTIHFFNNTLFDATGFLLMGSSKNGGRIVFTDNIAVSTTPGAATTVFGANVSSAHNCFFSPGQATFASGSLKTISFKDYQQQSRLDQDSIFADPQFANPQPVSPQDFRIASTSACNSPAVGMSASEDSASTYDHDQRGYGPAIIGALRVAALPSPTSIHYQCSTACLGHAFLVPNGVYLVRLTLAPVPEQTRSLQLDLNGRSISVESGNAMTSGTGSAIRDFLVRADRGQITVTSHDSSLASAVAGLEILAFDTNHGEEAQIIPW